jgi:hypothetical protein
VLSGRVSRSRAWRICSAVMAGGRPRRAPRPRAASSPSRVPSMISSRMNSARAAKTWKTSRPPGVVLSRASCRLLKPTPCRRSVVTMAIRFGQRPGQPVQARHDQGVAGPQVVQAGGQLGPVGVFAGQLVGEHAQAARFGQGVLLPVEQLAGGADPGVADQRAGPHGRFRGQQAAGSIGGIGGRHGHIPDCKRKGPDPVVGHAGFTTRFTTAAKRPPPGPSVRR